MKSATDPNAELAMAIAKGALSSIPYAGGVIAEVANLYLNPLEKRKEAWAKRAQQAIEEIHERFARLPESLLDDEMFISSLYQLSDLAIKNHQQEKLELLRNAIVSAANPERASDDLILQFIRYVDELSVSHLRVLTELDKCPEVLESADRFEEIYAHLQMQSGAPLDCTVFRSFVQDLDAKFLIRIGDIDDFPQFATKVTKIVTEESSKRPLEVTDLGRMFLSFVRSGEQ